MKKVRRLHGVDVVYHDEGEGPCIVLLHGYLESAGIWNSFARELVGQFRILRLDLPGHGESGTWGSMHRMEELATVVRDIAEEEGLRRILLVGHSMGGYVTMAFADLYPELLAGYVLLHSTPFADNEEKKQNRDREISLIQCGKKGQIVHVNIPKAFADGNVERMASSVLRAKDIAFACPDEGIVALLQGMKERPDRSRVLAEGDTPVLLVGGKKDNYISEAIFARLQSLVPRAQVLTLDSSGHMGFLEETDKVVEALENFSDRLDWK